jgi:TIR domain
VGGVMAGEAIFVGYRRDDTADVAGRIYDAMAQRFGKARVFKDVDNIGPGMDFGDYIKTVLPRCRVALVLIGPHWLAPNDETGRRRLDDIHDWVRIEIETALATPGLLVVPVLVNGARMPRAEELPDSLKPLLRRNAAIIRRDPDFHDDIERLATAIRSSVNTGIIDLRARSKKRCVISATYDSVGLRTNRRS